MSWSPVIETKRAPLTVTDARADGLIEGYASLFGVVDLCGDLVEKGAFAASLRRRGSDVRCLFQHDPAEPIGAWHEVAEDSRGLYACGKLNLAVGRGREVAALLAQGALDGLSIGFKTLRARKDSRSGVRRLMEIDLWEVSVVTFPMLPEARVIASRSRRWTPKNFRLPSPPPLSSPARPKAKGRGPRPSFS